MGMLSEKISNIRKRIFDKKTFEKTGLRSLIAAGAFLSAFVVQGATPPVYHGGEEAMASYFEIRMKYPAMAKENAIEGRVLVKALIEADGSVSDVKIARGLDLDLDKEALRLVSEMPEWEPAVNDAGEAYAEWVIVPVMFRLDEE